MNNAAEQQREERIDRPSDGTGIWAAFAPDTGSGRQAANGRARATRAEQHSERTFPSAKFGSRSVSPLKSSLPAGACPTMRFTFPIAARSAIKSAHASGTPSRSSTSSNTLRVVASQIWRSAFYFGRVAEVVEPAGTVLGCRVPAPFRDEETGDRFAPRQVATARIAGTYRATTQANLVVGEIVGSGRANAYAARSDRRAAERRVTQPLEFGDEQTESVGRAAGGWPVRDHHRSARARSRPAPRSSPDAMTAEPVELVEPLRGGRAWACATRPRRSRSSPAARSSSKSHWTSAIDLVAARPPRCEFLSRRARRLP